jgi:hypothetical protein
MSELELHPSANDFVEATFADESGAKWYIGQSTVVGFDDVVYVGEDRSDEAPGCSMVLNREAVRALLPLLTRFAETGSLAETEGRQT